MSFGFLVLPCWQKELLHLHHLGNHGHAVRLKTAPGSEASFLPAKGGCSVALLCCPQGGSPIGTVCQIERGNDLKKPPQSGTCLLCILLSFDAFWAPSQTPWPPPVPTQYPQTQCCPCSLARHVAGSQTDAGPLPLLGVAGFLASFLHWATSHTSIDHSGEFLSPPWAAVCRWLQSPCLLLWIESPQTQCLSCWSCESEFLFCLFCFVFSLQR